MRYFVKTEAGELAFDSVTHLREMYEKGLVEPEDQVRPEDSPIWRKAEAVPELRGRLSERKKEQGWRIWGAAVAVLLAVALRLLVSGHYIAAAVAIFSVLGLTQFTLARVYQRRQPGSRS